MSGRDLHGSGRHELMSDSRLQRFKLDVASSVVTQQNAGLGSMNTGEVLDLFKVSADGEPIKQSKAGNGPVSTSKALEG